MTFFYKTIYCPAFSAYMSIMIFLQKICLLVVVLKRDEQARHTALSLNETTDETAARTPEQYLIPSINRNLYEAETGIYKHPGRLLNNFILPFTSGSLKLQVLQFKRKADSGFRNLYAKTYLNGQSNCYSCFWQTEAYRVN